MTDTAPPNPATGTFAVELSHSDPLLPGTGRLTFAKTWEGDISGTSR